MENARKLKKSDILKPGTKLKAKKIDFNDPEIIAKIEAVNEERKKCLERKNVNWNELNNTYINI
jgi:hypothetical protein